MTVKDVLDGIKVSEGYIANSLVIKSSNESGIVYKWLVVSNDKAVRKEIFIASDSEEVLGEDRVVITNVEVIPAE